MGSLDVSFGGSNIEKLKGSLLEASLVSTDCKMIGSDKSIKLGSTYGEMLGVVIRFIIVSA